MICGILACLLHGNKFKRGDKEDFPTARSGQGLRQNSISKKRILVCAQSNSAIDELLGSSWTSSFDEHTHNTAFRCIVTPFGCTQSIQLCDIAGRLDRTGVCSSGTSTRAVAMIRYALLHLLAWSCVLLWLCIALKLKPGM